MLASDEAFIGSGALAVERRLVDEVASFRAAVREAPEQLAHPLVVVVPSRSLRDHVSALLVRRLGALAGVSVQTHHTTALQILERAGVAPLSGAEWMPVLAQREARRAPGLAALRALTDAHGAVVAPVSDLLDAGLDEHTEAAVRDRLDALEATAGVARRVSAVVDVALAVHRGLAERGLGRLADVIRQARAALVADAALFPAGRVLVHGFADATGLVTDFLRTLLLERSSLVLLDQPPDPADPERPDLGAAYAARFQEAVAPFAKAGSGSSEEPPQVDFFRAPGTDAEVRAVAQRILAQSEAGTAWERMAIVTRTPSLYASSLRVQLGRLGIPYSGVGLSGPLTPRARRGAFLVDWLRLRERLPVDRFVNALGRLAPGRRDDLRLGLHALGVARLEDLVALDVAVVLGDADRFPLPVRRGLEGSGDDAPEGEPAEGRASRGPHAVRRALHRDALLEARERAVRALEGLQPAEESLPLGERIAALCAALEAAFGWGKDADTAWLLGVVRGLQGPLPAAEGVRLDELALVLARACGRAAQGAIGGGGGGVQVLDVVEARARTFERLFVVGLNRDHFPRVVSDDPLLPDAVRQRLQEVLPELPVKERGHDEERFLFAQLVSSAPHVTLSWQLLGDDGKAKAPSPLVDRLLPPGFEVELVPTLLAPPERDVEGRHALRPAHEWALLEGLHTSRHALLEPALHELAGGERGAEAAARQRVLGECESRRGAALGPYFGHVGPVREASDPRHDDLWVTGVEAIARCPWRAFLTRVLRLEQTPDALEALPDATPLLQGRIVHDVLERVVTECIGETEDGARVLERPPTPVAWPAPSVLLAWAEQAARRQLLAEGIGVSGFAEVLAHRAMPALEVARDLDWAEGPVPVVGVEVEGATTVETPQGPRRVRFRADRVDRREDGLHLTDYKTGTPLSEAKTPETRRSHFQDKVTSGDGLQAAAYAGIARGAMGRFLYLKPDLDPRTRELVVGPEDTGLQHAFAHAVARVAQAESLGTFVPRLFDAGGREPKTCGWCEVAVACVRGDSGARRRLTDWADAPPRTEDARERALRGIWRMEPPDDA